jgi:hypothetical protein
MWLCNGSTAIDSEQAMCLGHCACTAMTCSSSVDADSRFDATSTGPNTLRGTLAVGDTVRLNVVLTRAD